VCGFVDRVVDEVDDARDGVAEVQQQDGAPSAPGGRWTDRAVCRPCVVPRQEP
jgi:hypothetical protein